MYKKTQLSNGIRVVTNDIKNRDSIAIGIFVKVGGRYEDDRIKGAAHYLEHMLFKGSRKYSCESIKESIEGIGGTLNAYTSEEQTCYYAKIPSKHLDATFDVLSDMVFYPRLSSLDMTKERTVILEEIKMYRDLPQYYVLELLESMVWPKHPLGKNLAGTFKSVSALKATDLRRFHGSHYVPENIVVSACGNLKGKDILELVNSKLNNVKGKRQADFIRFNEKQLSPKADFFYKDIEQVHLALGIPGVADVNKDKYVLALISVILGGNMSSRLFNELREKKGLAYSVSSSSKSLCDTGVFLIRGGFDRKRIDVALELILKELKKIKKTSVSKNEFLRGKDYLLGQMMLALEDTMDHMLCMGDSIVSLNKLKTLKDLVSEFEKIKISDISRVATQIFDESKYNLAIVGPIKDSQQAKLRQLIGAKG